MRCILNILVLTLFPAAAMADQSVELVKAYAFDTTPGMANGAAYVQLLNKGPSAATLIGATSDIAAYVQVHDHIMDGDIMRMRQVEEPPAIGSDEVLTMAPGGMHIMLLGLTQPLAIGDIFTVTLHLEGHNTRDLEIEVEVFGIDMRDELVGSDGMNHDMATDPGEMDGMDHSEHGS